MSEKKRKRSFGHFKVFVENEIFLLFFRLCQKLSLSFRKRKSKSLLSLFFLSWEWKSFTKNKISRYLNNFVNVLLICDKIRRFALFNSSMISAISFVENIILLILWRLLLIVSMFRCLCFFVFLLKIKKEILFLFLSNFRFKIHLMSCFFRFF